MQASGSRKPCHRRNAHNILQRYLLSLFYYLLTQNGQVEWRSCNPIGCQQPVSSKFDYNCTYEKFIRSDANDSFEQESIPSISWCLRIMNVNGQVWLAMQQMWYVRPLVGQTLQELNPRSLLVLLLCNRLHFITMSSKGPYQPNMQRWRNLINLDIRGNFLTGTIPDKLWDATLVQQLNFAESDLTGSKGPRLKSWETWKTFMLVKINWQAAYHQRLETLFPWCSLGSTQICFKIVCPPSSAGALN